MTIIRTICVYCGSGSGTDPAFAEAARDLGRQFAEKGISLVYGGGSTGIMGALASSVLSHGGKVTGIIPEFLIKRERMLESAHELIVTPDMHERKRKMFEHADAFIALPGGIGTLEELIEQMTWAQLGRHRKPIIIANIKQFWEPLLALLDHMRSLAFIRPEFAAGLRVVDRTEDILPAIFAAARTLAPVEDQKAATATIERM